MNEHDSLTAAVAAVEEAGPDPGRWSAALGAIADLFGAQFATLETFDPESHRHIGFRASRLDADAMNAYLKHYADLSPRTKYIWRQPGRAIVYDHLVMDEAGMDRDPFYQEFLAPADLRYFISGSVSRTRGQHAVVSLQRDRRRGHVSPRDIEKLRLLLPSLRNSADLTRRLSTAGGAALSGALDWLSDAVAVLSPQATVVYANAAMEEIFSQGDGIGLKSGTLRFAHPASADRFARALAAIRHNRLDPLASLHTADLVVPRSSAAAPYVVAVRALPATVADRLYLAADPMAIVFVRDPRQRAPHVGASIRLAFALTEAESQLAGALRQGVSPHDYADARGISRNTAYTHLRRLKEKLGCDTVAGLVRLLERMHLPVASPVEEPAPAVSSEADPRDPSGEKD